MKGLSEEMLKEMCGVGNDSAFVNGLLSGCEELTGKARVPYASVRVGDDGELYVEVRFDDGQKYSICTVDPEFEGLAHWLSAQINEGKVPRL